MDISSKLEEYIHKQIPLARALGFHAVTITPQEVVASAPFALNTNHKNTVFGGSLHCLATLACWSLLHVNLQNFDLPLDLVITDSTIKYLKPVTSDFSARCLRPGDDMWLRFIKGIKSKRRARIVLEASIYQGDELAVDYRGTFAAIVKNTEKQ